MMKSNTRGLAWLRDQFEFQKERVLERADYPEDLKVAECQRQKATTDLRALRQLHEELKTKFTKAEKSAEATINGLTKKLETSQAELNSNKERADYWYKKHEKAANNNSTLQEQLARTKNTERNLCRSHDSLWAKNHALREQIKELTEVGSTNAVSESPEYRQLRWDLDETKRLLDLEKDNCRALQEDYNNVIDTRNSTRSQMVELKKLLEETEKNLQSTGLKMSSLGLEKLIFECDAKKKEPLVKIGAAIRLRFLENSREVVFNVPREELDLALILDGNGAAHAGNGLADAALFKAGLVPENCLVECNKVFQELYQCEPREEYHLFMSKMARILDCETTVRVLKASHRSKNDSAAEREEYEGHITTLLNHYQHVLSQEDFEADENVERLVLQVEKLADKIVQIDRGRKNRLRYYRQEVSAPFWSFVWHKLILHSQPKQTNTIVILS